MANYNNLKTAIQGVIKANGNQEITGDILQNALLSMINSLGAGYQFMGVATPETNPGTPDPKVFYLAATSGTYVNFSNLHIDENEIAVLIYDTTWQKKKLVRFDENLGYGVRTFSVTKGQAHSSTIDRIDVNIKAGETFYVSGKMQEGNVRYFSILAKYKGQTSSTDIGVVYVGNGYKMFIANDDIEFLGYYLDGANIIESGILSITSLSGIYAEPNNIKRIIEEQGKTLQKQFVMVDATDGFNNTTKNVILDTQNRSVTIRKNGIRLKALEKVFSLYGETDFVMSYKQDTAPNGAWMLSLDAVKNVKNGGKIELNSTNIFYASVETVGYQKNIVLFQSYYDYLCPTGLLGNLLLQRQIERTNSELKSLDNLAPSVCIAIDALNNTTKNVEIGENKTIIIKSKGIRIKYLGKTFSLSGSEDMVMSYDSQTAPNGAWMLSLDAVKNAVDGGHVELDSTNIFYAGVETSLYKNNIVLFSTYYDNYVANGLLGDFLLSRRIESIADSVDIPTAMRNYAFNSVYNEKDITDKCKEFSSLINNSGLSESFIFMTDPHLLGSENTFNVNVFKDYIGLLQKYYNSLPVDWMICGGDWLSNSDYQSNACWKLGYMDATMRKLFKNYYPILGNHDTNYQGVVSESDSSRGDLTHQTLVNLMFRTNKNTYYIWSGNNTRFFVFDTQTDWESEMNDFKWEQIDWFANKLLTNTNDHIIVLQHIYYTSGVNIAPMSEQIQSLSGAFNNKEEVTINAKTYNFTSAKGKIHCIIAGHSHRDAIITDSNIPVWLTANMMKDNIPTFDLMFVDYVKNQIQAIRVGSGENRTMNLA